MDNSIHQQMNDAQATANAEVAKQYQWPTTKAPELVTKQPLPPRYTNPPIVVPVNQGPPPDTPYQPDMPGQMPDDQTDCTPEIGSNDSADFRPDLSEYHLVLVRDKDVPNTAGYDPRSKLKNFPRGTLPGSNETFYMVTHRFADRAGVNGNMRGNIVIHASSTGQPRAPLNANGKDGTERMEGEGGTVTTVASQFTTATWIAIVVIAALVVYIIVMKKKQEQRTYDM